MFEPLKFYCMKVPKNSNTDSSKTVLTMQFLCVIQCVSVTAGMQFYYLCSSGPGCSKLTTSLVNVSLKFLTLISEMCQYFSEQKISVHLLINS